MAPFQGATANFPFPEVFDLRLLSGTSSRCGYVFRGMGIPPIRPCVSGALTFPATGKAPKQIKTGEHQHEGFPNAGAMRTG